MKIKKGDQVISLLGKDKGRSGEVILSFPKKHTILVKGLNVFKKHVKATQNQPGSIIEKERAMTISKVALICPSCKKATRVGYQIDKSGSKYRVCKKCASLIDTKTTK